MKTTICPVCDSPRAEERRYSDKINKKNKPIVVTGLRRFFCPDCESVFANDEQSRHNLALTQEASAEEPRYLLPTVIKRWRELVGLTQRQAARLFGGGTNAFSKYELGEIMQSESMDNLLWLVMRYPGLIGDLAGRRNVLLPPDVLNKCGSVLQMQFNALTLPFTSMQIPSISIGQSDRLTIGRQMTASYFSDLQNLTFSATDTAANETNFAIARRA